MLTCKSLFGLGYRGERLIEPSALVVDRAGGIQRMNVPALVLLFREKARRHRQIAGKPRGVSFLEAPWASGTAGSRAERRARHRGESRGYGNKPRSPWGYRQPTPSLFSSKGTVAVQRLDGGGSPSARSFGRPKVQSVPPERGPAGGRGEGLFLPPPLRARRGRVQQVVSTLRVDPRCFFCLGDAAENPFSLVSLIFLLLRFSSFAGCVAQMVERSLRMRQVLGSMPSASMRERREGGGEGAQRAAESAPLSRVRPPFETLRGPSRTETASLLPRGRRFACPAGVNASSWFPPKFPPG